MRFGAAHVALAIAAVSGTRVTAAELMPRGPRRHAVSPGPILAAGEQLGPDALNRLARKNARARQTKRGKRGRR